MYFFQLPLTTIPGSVTVSNPPATDIIAKDSDTLNAVISFAINHSKFRRFRIQNDINTNHWVAIYITQDNCVFLCHILNLTTNIFFF